MPTRREGASAATSRAPSTRRKPRVGGPVRVWSECGVTVAVTDDPPQFIRFTTGHERVAPNDKPATVRRVEREIYEDCEKIVERRTKQLIKLVQAASTPSAGLPASRRSRRS